MIPVLLLAILIDRKDSSWVSLDSNVCLLRWSRRPERILVNYLPRYSCFLHHPILMFLFGKVLKRVAGAEFTK